MADPETRMILYCYAPVTVNVRAYVATGTDVRMFVLNAKTYKSDEFTAFKNDSDNPLEAKVYGIQSKGIVRLTPVVLASPADLIVVYDVNRKDPWPKPPPPPTKFYLDNPSATPWNDHGDFFMRPSGFGGAAPPAEAR